MTFRAGRGDKPHAGLTHQHRCICVRASPNAGALRDICCRSRGFPRRSGRLSRALRAHHHERLSELLEACSQQALSAHDALPLIFRRALDVHQTTFAMGEAVAHLNLLWLSGQMHRERGADGVLRFSTNSV